MKKLPTLFSLLAVLFCHALQAGPYYSFEHYTTYDGLPSNTIHCTYQDRFGFVWIGTRDGLSRFDGYDFRSPGGPYGTGMTHLASMDLEEDEDGLLWFTTSDGVGYYNPFTGHTHDVGRLGQALVFDLATDRNGSVWFAGDKMYRHVKETGGIQEYAFERSTPSRVAVDSYGAVWTVLNDGSLYSYDRRTDSFRPAPFPRALTDIRTAENGKLLAATADGEVLLIETSNMAATKIFSAGGREIRKVLERRPGEFWIGTNSGLFVRQSDGELSEILHDARDPHSLSANFITSLDKDKYGNVWIGTYYTGIDMWQDNQGEFTVFYQNPTERSIRGTIVRSIAADGDGNIWFCTEDGGLNCLSPDHQEGSSYVVEPDLNMQGLTIVGDEIWIHTFGRGVFRYDRIRHRVLRHYDLPNSSGCGLRTADGRIWSGSMAGLYVYDPAQDAFVSADPSVSSFVHCLFQDSRGIIWVGTYGNGLLCLDSGGNVLARLTQGSRERGLSADRITSFFEDSHRRIWITTEGGGVCYTDPEPNLSNLQLKSIRRGDGLISNVTCSVLEDEEGTLWVTTTRGISRLDGETLSVLDYIFDRQQILGSQFSYGAALATPGGQFYLGNTSGMVAVSPAKLKRAARSYPLYITSIEATHANRTVQLHEADRSTLQTERIRIKAKDASLLSISFASPNYSILRQVAYRYTLTHGRREVLNAVLTDNQVNFSGLRPGRYRFDVGIVGADSDSSRQSLEFDILAPLLWSRGARIVYLVLLAGLVALFLRELEKKRLRDRARHLSKVEHQKEKELYDAKINFFTNITHEIRTPLTLIKMPLDKLIAAKEYTPAAEKDMLTIQANTDRLLTLTNQLLDLRKMDKNDIKPVFLKEDLCAVIRKVCHYFEQMAREQKIVLNEDIPDAPFEVMCVRDSVEKIVSNLLSNAVKYCQGRIDLSLRPSEDGKTAILRVNSDGAMIPARDAERIFEIFYQVGDSRKGKGTGLGLPFARTLANLHNGKLFLDTGVRDFNSFVLELPVVQPENFSLEEEQPEAEPVRESDGVQDHDGSRHTLLLVEDSAEMREYLADELSDEYNVITAVNGQDAVEKLKEERIDLVISDIMMPVMDGCQLCNYVKTNMEYSHLPVLLLTAAVGMETRLQTLEVGADGYIEKPFPIELLRANIANLFKNREISYKQFTNSPLTHFNSVNTSKMDEEFMDKLHGIVMKHMAEQDLSIETLTGLIGTSKSSPYRKVKANTGLNSNEYIRLCRLKQAAEMLSSQKYRINEVAYMVGFSSPSYFATSFQKQFNISPSAFVKNLKD